MTDSLFEQPGVGRPSVLSRPENSGVVDRTRGGAEAVAVATGTSGTVVIDCSFGSVFTLIPTANVTALVLRNAPQAGKACFLTLIVSQGATAYAIATPAGGVFMGAATPTQVANKVCIFNYLTVDGGATWYCYAAVQI